MVAIHTIPANLNTPVETVPVRTIDAADLNAVLL